jgi:hypothetical protein
MQRDFAVLSQARVLKKITNEPENGGERLITQVGDVIASNYPRYKLSWIQVSMLVVSALKSFGGIIHAVAPFLNCRR